jgi:hypothetical protein
VGIAITLSDVDQAVRFRDPALADLVCALAAAPAPRGPVPEGAATVKRSLDRLASRAFKKLGAAERRAERSAHIAALGSEQAVVPERLQLDRVLLALWRDDDALSRAQLLDIVARVPLVWGPWRALKQIFKESEAQQDWEMFGALAARLDAVYASGRAGEVSRPTIRYLVRRAWRALRRLAVALPAAYPDAACQVLRQLPDGVDLHRTWVASHVLFGGSASFTRSRMRPNRRLKPDQPRHRAYPASWRLSPRPLLGLVERARSGAVASFAIASLQSDFRAALREVEPAWVARLVEVPRAAVHDFVTWLLEHAPRLEAERYRELGLHQPVLRLLDSPSQDAATWAASYARTHARDLALERLIELVANPVEAVRKTARDLIRARDPRKEVGLQAWGQLLGSRNGHRMAAAALRDHFGARELTLAWFTERLLSPNKQVVDFASGLLDKVHPPKGVPTDFWVSVLDAPTVASWGADSALDRLELRGLDGVAADVLRRAMLHPGIRPEVGWQQRQRGVQSHASRVERWLREGRVAPATLGADFFKMLVTPDGFAADPWVLALKQSGRPWAVELEHEARLGSVARDHLSDRRTFSAAEVGFDWLFALVQRTDAAVHDFAVTLLTRSFAPSDFVVSDAAPVVAQAAGPVEVDLGGQTFLFTGKLATMTRGEAKKKVTGAGGLSSSGVTAKLDYLVIGDEGSPLYGGGRKGSKQVKAERLIEAGSAMQIISETAFLKRLAGEESVVDAGDALAGAERIWELAVSEGPPDAPLRSFALHYLRHHHALIHMAETDRPLDPGQELPAEFLTFDRAKALVADSRAPQRALGLLWLRWELAGWAPPLSQMVALCELPDEGVRAFAQLALTADDTREHRRYRLDPAILTPEAVYRFCESADAATRAFGLTLIGLHPRLAVPEELFRLTESPDRGVRSFVIRELWRLYRTRPSTPHWTPKVGEGPAGRPQELPASTEAVRDFLRRTLFGIPPARAPRVRVGGRRLSARKAKLALIELCRDLAVEDAAFAERLRPLLAEFLGSRGASEQAACLVALTRIDAAHPGLGGGR